MDFVICEDTRVSAKLLNHYEIKKEMVSFHAQSSPAKIESIIARLADGQEAAIISDAGTPGISDPGYRLIQEAIAQDITITPIPGPSAVLAGLVASGMHTHHFLYLGFLPVKKGRKTLLDRLKDKDHTVVIYESPHRILKTLSQLQETFGEDHHICLAREITKIHETFLRGSVSEILQQCTQTPVK